MNIRSIRHGGAGRRGVTLTELLVVLAIIGLLATIAVPTYLSKVELARVRTAQEEVKSLAEAEEVVALTHGFYVPLQMLDDNPSPENADRDRDDIYNTRQQLNPCYLIDPAIDVNIQVTTSAQLRLQYSDPTSSATFVKRVGDLYTFWDGPYMNFTRVWTGIDYNLNVVEALTDSQRARRYPLDPWGNPYRWYSPIGIIGTTADSTDPRNYDNDNFGNGELTFRGDYEFDRFAVVSFGPNGVEGPLTNNNRDNDDIFYTFGRIPNNASFRRF